MSEGADGATSNSDNAGSGWYIVAAVLGLLTAIDFLFGSYSGEITQVVRDMVGREVQSIGPTTRSVDCGNGFNVLFGDAPDACDEHRGIVLARVVVGGGLAGGAAWRAEVVNARETAK